MFRRVILVPVLVLWATAAVTADLFQIRKNDLHNPLVFLDFATEEPPLTEAASEEECDWELDTEVCVKRLLKKEGDKKIRRGWVDLRARHQNHTLYWRDNIDLWKAMTVKIRQRMGELKETKAREREILRRRLEDQLLKMKEEEKKQEDKEGRKLVKSSGFEGLSEAEIRRKLEKMKQKIRAEWEKQISGLELTMNALLAQM